jgi:hypothetical protein
MTPSMKLTLLVILAGLILPIALLLARLMFTGAWCLRAWWRCRRR